MNDLEREYVENVERAKERDARSRVFYIVWYLAFALVLGVVDAVHDFSTWSLLRVVSVLGALGLLPAFWLAKRFKKWFEDRNVVIATTERERAYRDPVSVTREAEVRPSKPSLLALCALIPVGAATLTLGVLTYDPHTRRDPVIPLGITLTMMGFILVGKRLHATWRARRNARLELEWEKWLDSADSCEVGPRKWTK